MSPAANPKVTQQWRNIPSLKQECLLFIPLSVMVQRAGEGMIWLFLTSSNSSSSKWEEVSAFLHSFSTVQRSLVVLKHPESNNTAVHFLCYSWWREFKLLFQAFPLSKPRRYAVWGFGEEQAFRVLIVQWLLKAVWRNVVTFSRFSLVFVWIFCQATLFISKTMK